jgi:hypothetical protein
MAANTPLGTSAPTVRIWRWAASEAELMSLIDHPCCPSASAVTQILQGALASSPGESRPMARLAVLSEQTGRQMITAESAGSVVSVAAPEDMEHPGEWATRRVPRVSGPIAVSLLLLSSLDDARPLPSVLTPSAAVTPSKSAESRRLQDRMEGHAPSVPLYCCADTLTRSVRRCNHTCSWWNPKPWVRYSGRFREQRPEARSATTSTVLGLYRGAGRSLEASLGTPLSQGHGHPFFRPHLLELTASPLSLSRSPR